MNGAVNLSAVASTPPNLTVVQSGLTEITISWSQPPPGITTGYTIEYGSDGVDSGGSVNITQGSTDYQLINLWNGVFYRILFISKSSHYHNVSTFDVPMGE